MALSLSLFSVQLITSLAAIIFPVPVQDSPITPVRTNQQESLPATLPSRRAPSKSP